MPDDAPALQRWTLMVDDRTHRVEASGHVSRRLEWYVDDELVAETKSSSDKVQLTPKERPELGAVGVRFSGMGSPRRATLFEPDQTSKLDPTALAVAGLGGLDLEPEPGSPAARHEDRVRQSPRRYAALAVAGGVAKVVVPLLLVALFARFALTIPFPNWNLPNVPWPNLPDIDLPSIPWPNLPDLPSLPMPNLPDWTLPGWLVWVLDNAHFVWPVVLAVVLARGEIRRRHKQDELRAARARQRSDDEA
jgi:hypothetical protein